MGTGTGSNSVYKPKLSWFSFADSFLHKNFEDNKAAETNLVNHFSLFLCNCNIL